MAEIADVGIYECNCADTVQMYTIKVAGMRFVRIASTNPDLSTRIATELMGLALPFCFSMDKTDPHGHVVFSVLDINVRELNDIPQDLWDEFVRTIDKC